MEHSQPMTVDVGDALICVVGARRSGTHWMQRVLAAHPDVASVPGESYLFSRAIAPLFDRFHHATPASGVVGQIFVERETLLSHARSLCDAALGPYLTADVGNPTRVVERTPEHVLHIELIASLYPRARFVHIIRDPQSVVRSLLDQKWATDDVAQAATEWRTAVAAGRAQGANLDNYIEVRYENLRAEPIAEVHRIFTSVGLDASDASVAHAVAEAGVVANTQARGPRSPLRRRHARIVKKITGDVVEDLDARPASVGPRPADTGGEETEERETAPPSGEPAAQEEHWMRSNPHYVTMGVNRLLEVLRGARPPEAVDLEDRGEVLAPDVGFRLVAGGADRHWRGREQLPDVLAAIVDLGVFQSAARWSAQHSCMHLHVVVFHGDSDGSTNDTVVVNRIGRHGVAEVAIYAFPLGDDAHDAARGPLRAPPRR